MFEYVHKVHYYETDKMGIVHHSNYIRWMEEARVDFLDEIGASFAEMEARGLQSPVVGVNCKYRRPTRFDDRVRVRVSIEKYNGAVLKVAYEMYNETTGELACTGSSEHCFLDSSGKLVALHRCCADIDAAIRKHVRSEN